MVIQDQELSTPNSRSLTDVANPMDEDFIPNETAGVPSSSRGRRRSEIWKHFEKKIVSGIWKSECNYCHKHLGGNSKHGTSHLHEHIKRCPVFAGDLVIQNQELPVEDSRSLIAVSDPVEEESTPNEIVPVSSSSQDGRRSDVWRHYVRKTVSGIWKSECNYCHKHLSGNPKHGTKHLHDHIKRCPVLLGAGIRKHVMTRKMMKVYCSSIQDDGRSLDYMKVRCPFNQDDGTRALIHMIIMHEYPLNIVEHPGFRNYSTVLQSLFKCPSRNTINNDIMEIYDRERRKVMELLKNCDSRVAITYDMWTTDNKRRGYMAITGYYIDASWSLQSRMLRFVYVPYPYIEETLYEVLMDCLIDWDIDSKLSTITLENCSASDMICESVRKKINSDSIMLSGRFLYMHCVAHVLNLIIRDGLQVIVDRIEEIRDSVAYWTATPEREEKFEETANQLKIPFSRRLILDSPTQWTTTYEMLETTLMYSDVFYWLRQHDLQYKMLPGETDWKLCAEVCEKLKLFYSITELFSSTRHSTANLCFPNVCQIRVALNFWHGSSNKVISNMAKTMLGKFEKYWDGNYVVMGVLTVLDPRFKMKLIEYYFPAIYGDKAPFHVKKIRDACYDLLGEYWSRYKIQEEYENEISASNQLDCFRSQELDKDMFGYDAFVKKQKKKDASFLKTELDKYLEDDVLPRTPDFDVLLWWKSNGNTYPLLKAIARDLLAIQVSTMPSKLAFSTNGRIVDSHLSGLPPKTIEALFCTRNWLGDVQTKDGAASGLTNSATIHDNMDIESEEIF